MANYKEEYLHWMESPSLSEEEWKELDSIKDDEKEIESRFFAPLEFGTAGLRGTMKTGLHHMNIHVIRHATQAFATVICAEGEEAKAKGIAIAHDCRNHGHEFAVEAACVMAANGIHVRLFDALRPTPELSFAVIHYGCCAGLNITASHNPKEYNGYKVYWSDGAQLPPDHAEAIAKEMASTDIFTCYKTMNYDDAVKAGLIEILSDETDEAFMQEVMTQQVDKTVIPSVADTFKVVYTPFHGCGYKEVPEVLKRCGLKYLYPVKEQMVLDGDFPTVKSPNPENPEGFYLAIELAKSVGSDLIVGTDPDSDRVGVMVRDGDTYKTITGNQMGILLIDYIISAHQRNGTMPANPAVTTSIVSSIMTRRVAEYNNVICDETFTGFKFLAEKVSGWKKEGINYLMAFEESYGYMFGDYVRDKDAVTASMVIVEMAAYYYKQGMTLADAMKKLYEKYGWYSELTLNLVMPGLDGLAKMKELMATLRTTPPTEIGGIAVSKIRDYADGSVIVPELGKLGETPIKGSNVLYYELADGSVFIVRPSGTEPKIKVYLLVHGDSEAECSATIAKLKGYADSLAN